MDSSTKATSSPVISERRVLKCRPIKVGSRRDLRMKLEFGLRGAVFLSLHVGIVFPQLAAVKVRRKRLTPPRSSCTLLLFIHSCLHRIGIERNNKIIIIDSHIRSSIISLGSHAHNTGLHPWKADNLWRIRHTLSNHYCGSSRLKQRRQRPSLY